MEVFGNHTDLKKVLIATATVSLIYGSRGCSIGPMIISDALLEDANPDYLTNTGLFAFPPPFTIKLVSSTEIFRICL